MPNLDPLCVVSDYRQLQAALRERADALGFSRLDIDAVSGLPTGYSGKVLSPAACEPDRSRKTRTLGMISLGLMLEALGLRMILAADPEATERAKQLAFSREGRCDPVVSAFYRHVAKKRQGRPRRRDAA